MSSPEVRSPGPAPWWRARWAMVSGICLAVVALVVAVVAVVVGTNRGSAGSGRFAEVNRAPFDGALIRLATAPAMRYRISLGAGLSTVDVRTASNGESVGTFALAGQKFGVLTVGGRTYIKPPDGLVPPGTTGAKPAALSGRWITGGSATASTLGAASAGPGTPLALAQSLIAALNDNASLPDADDPGTTIDGTAALKAVTSMGALYVTKDPPYRVLRIERSASGSGPKSKSGSGPKPPSLPELPSLPSLPPLPSLPSLPSFAPPAPGQHFAPAPVAGLGTIDLSQLSPAEVDRMFDELVNDTKQLKDAVDTDIQFDLRGNAQVKCGNTGCVVTANVTGSTTSTDPDAKVTGGSATGQLTATVQIDGRPAGGCTATAPLPVNGAGTISCQNPGAGAVFTAVDAQKRKVAEAQSKAEGGAPVPYTIEVTGDAEVTAEATVEVEVLVQTLQSEADLAMQQAQQQTRPQPTVTATPSPGPVGQPSPAPSGRPSPPPLPVPTPSGRHCGSPPPNAEVQANGWILYSSAPNGRAERGQACLAPPMNGPRTAPRVDPVGWTTAMAKVRSVGGNPQRDLARCHIIGAQFGGSNVRRDNVVPCWQNGTNVASVADPQGMTRFENRVVNEINSRPSDILEYQVQPDYRSATSTIPFGFTMIAVVFSPTGAVTWVDYAQLLNEKVVNRRVVNLGN